MIRSCIFWIVLTTVDALGASARADAPTAEDLYSEGLTAYNRADYATAITQWRTSYQLSGADRLLFNLAQAYRLNGDCTEAITTYRRFVAADSTDAEQHKLAEDFVRELEPTCPAPIVTTAPTVHVKPHDARHGHALKTAGLVTGGAGAASIVAGLLLGHHGSAIGADITRTCTVSCDWSMQSSSDAAGRRDVTVGYALDAVGAAAIVSGAILYYLGDRENGITLSPLPRESGAVVSWNGTW